MSATKVCIYPLGKRGLGEVTGPKYVGSHFSVPEVILAPIDVAPVPHAFQGNLANQAKGYLSRPDNRQSYASNGHRFLWQR